MKYIIVIFMLLGFICTAGAQEREPAKNDYIRHIGTGSINWTEGRVHSVGSSRMQDLEDQEKAARMAERDALVKARKALLDNLMQLNVDSTSRIGDLALQDPETARKLRALAHNSQVWETVYYHHPRDKVEVHVFLDLMDHDVQRLLPAAVFVGPEWRKTGRVAVNVMPYCSMYLDATGLRASPALVPAFVDRDGNILYKASVLGKQPGSRGGHVRYIRVDKDFNITRLYESGPQGFKVIAEGIDGQLESDFVLSWEDSLQLDDIAEGIPDDCPVIIIMGDE
ncbi:hypothetical protein [Desulfonatronospira sp.]|uniref:hypothetical protein n=1 Tax=Desulfonatronospira sp. TaxID=1962951 RepID=UPI0025C0953D|nr:hypothetical protein [Desulfonatronospira sp.]